MRLVFCLYKYFPYGGLQRDFLRIALACRARGHQARVLTLAWQGARPPELDVEILCVRGLTGPARYRRFSAAVQRQLASDPADAVIGFNKMPGLDIYYAADPCYAHKAHTQRGALYRLLPRYRHFARYEAAVFDSAARTQILMLSDLQRPFFERHYGTPAERFHALPPGIDRSRRAPPDAAAIRAEFRAEFDSAPISRCCCRSVRAFAPRAGPGVARPGRAAAGARRHAAVRDRPGRSGCLPAPGPATRRR